MPIDRCCLTDEEWEEVLDKTRERYFRLSIVAGAFFFDEPEPPVDPDEESDDDLTLDLYLF